MLATLALLALTLAGCVDGPQDGNDNDDGATTDPLRASLLADRMLPVPDGVAAHDLLVTFAGDFPLRLTGTPNEQAATDWLVDQLTGLGYDVKVQRLQPSVRDTAVPDATPIESLHAIVATMPGTDLGDHWLAWGGHYDTAPGTIEGAYDNGSGTIVSLEVARMMAQVETNRTKAVILFNGEEEGVLASSAYADWYAAQSDFTIDTFVGFDMVGIAYPAPGRPLCFFPGEAYAVDFVGLAREVAFGLLQFPDDNESVLLFNENTRNSDEASFASIGVPSMRFAGLRTAGAYWGYHMPNDTMETIYTMSGPDAATGQENFSQGLGNTALFATAMLVALDVRGPPEPVTA